MDRNTISILEGNTFVISDQHGDIEASSTEPVGLFSYDTRFLSRWILTVDGVRPSVLSTDDLDYFAVQFFLVPGTGTIYLDADCSIVRKRVIGRGFHEEITILNHKRIEQETFLRIEAAADFADLFEVKDGLPKKGQHFQRVDAGNKALILSYCREQFVREVRITSTADAVFDEHGISFNVHLEPHGAWSTCLQVTITKSVVNVPLSEALQADDLAPPLQLEKPAELKLWLAAMPRLSCEWRWLERIYNRSLIDLAALRFFPHTLPGKSLPAAGLPWLMALFGRDSIITSLQALPFTSGLAETTLLMLAAWQGMRLDDFRDEEPGKVVHELRFGELTAFEERPYSPYYGTADATPLFLILLDEYERWTGNAELVRNLETEAREALAWIDKYGDRDHDGYVEYERRNKQTGLENQCWKDSWNAILFADGTPSVLPRATCEIQGYVYDAKLRCARLARLFWQDRALAERLEREAADLKLRFNKDFWIAERGFFALALDGSGRQVDALTSNIGHLLWSGIVNKDKAKSCVAHLMGERLFSGWGVRTMAEGEGGYNPIGYHLGTVWPHDNALIAWGLWRYGYREEAARIASAILEAASFFGGRLPEAFAGYRRSFTGFPVEYPTACCPQAWSTGAPLLLIRTLLGLEPMGEHLLVDPAIPDMLGRLDIVDLPGRWGHIDASGRGRLHVPEEELRLTL